MSQFIAGPTRSFPNSAALNRFRRMVITAGVLAYAGASVPGLGTLEVSTTTDDEVGSVRVWSAEGTRLMVALAAITAFNPVYAAANGKIDASGTVVIGVALQSASADGDIIEVLPLQNTDLSAATPGTTAAAFEVDTDGAYPSIELAAQTGGTGDYKATIKPPATLTAARIYTLPGDFAGNLKSDYTQSLTAAADSGAGSSIAVGVSQVVVAGVTTDANDWIVLPAIASVPIGFSINIAANAGANFELRTPASSNTKINDVDSDGTQEYLCTDTDLIVVTKRTTTGWVAQSLTKLGAVRTAVVPD